MDFDEVLEKIGPFGKYQRIKFMMMSLPAAAIALHQLASVFLAATPAFSCDTKHPAYSNVSFAPYNGTDACAVPTYTYSSNGTVSTKNITCEHFSYSKEFFYSTIVTEWDLVCENKAKSTISTMVYMAGKLVGALLYGFLSDGIGRKKTALIAMFMVTCCGTGAAFAKNYYLFSALRFVVGASATGLYMCLFVLGMELLGKNYRMIAGIMICYFFALGYLILAGIAYLSRDWMYTEIAISAPFILFIFYYWLMPESARWLISRNRNEEAMEIVVEAAKVNGVKLPPDFTLEQETGKPSVSLRELASAKTLLCRCLIIFSNWFAVAMGYYGLTLNSGTLKGSIYVNFIISGGIEFVAYTAMFSISKLGRKGPHVFSMILAGLACLANILVDQFAQDVPEEEVSIYLIGLNTIGKFGMTMGYGIIYIWSAEIFPTSMRTSLMGLSSLMSRLGSIMAPLIADLGLYVADEYKIIIPSVIIGVLVLVTGLLSLALPETMGEDLPETVEEANNMSSKGSTRWSPGDTSKMTDYDNDRDYVSESKI